MSGYSQGYAEDYYIDLLDLQGILRKDIDGLSKPKLTMAQKTERIAEVVHKLESVKVKMQQLGVEMRDMTNPAEKKDYAAKKKALEEQFSQMHTDVHMIKQDFERQQVGVRTLDEMTTQEVLQEASRIQDKDLGALERMKQQIAQTGEVAAATATRLKGQTDQLKNIDTDVMKVKSNLARADLLVRAFMRKMMTDKIVMVFMCLIFCGIIAIVIYKIVDPKGAEDANLNVPDEVVKPLADRRTLTAFRALWSDARRERSLQDAARRTGLHAGQRD